MTHYAFSFDGTRCTGCKTCELVCKDYHDLGPGILFRRVYDYEGGAWARKDDGTWEKTAFNYHVALSCNHCDSPACVANCPTGAMQKDPETGIVNNDKEKCIGCMTCEKSCPYGHPVQLDDGLSHKCVLCSDENPEGVPDPTCAKACPYNARSYHDVDQSATPYYEGYEMTPYEEMRASEHPIGVVEKCVMCKERTAQGEEPSCVKTCITKSRWFGDLDDPTSEINVMIKKLGAKPLMEDLGTKPSVYYAGLV